MENGVFFVNEKTGPFGPVFSDFSDAYPRHHFSDTARDQQIRTAVHRRGGTVDEHNFAAAVIDQPGRRIDRQ